MKQLKIKNQKFSTGGGEENLTPNLNLKKPLETDFYNINDFNNNMDIIDLAIKNLQDQVINREVLWTNPKPKTAFNPQTINVPNLNYFDEIEIFFYNWVGGQYGIESVKVPVANGNAFHFSFTIMLWTTTGTPGTPHFGGRLGKLNTTNNTIYFDYCYGAVVNASPVGLVADSSWGVPFQIVGYKYGV